MTWKMTYIKGSLQLAGHEGEAVENVVLAHAVDPFTPEMFSYLKLFFSVLSVQPGVYTGSIFQVS